MPEVLARGRTSSVMGVYRINSSTWTVKRAGFFLLLWKLCKRLAVSS